jgi:phytoene dehydrogenase-like protein
MVAHLPDGSSVARWSGEERWEERRAAFGSPSESFWRWQEQASDAMWDLALRMPPWPPQSYPDAASLMRQGLGWLGDDLAGRLKPGLAFDALRPVASHLPARDGSRSERLRLFVDGQLLIASQTTSRSTNALYGASALDLPRRGAAHVQGGMGAIAGRLVESVRRNGGQVHFRQQATRIAVNGSEKPVAVETNKGATFPAETVVLNLTPWSVARLLGNSAPRRVKDLSPRPREVWGAFMTYVGLDASAVPENFALHHQVVVGEPFGNGNTVFLSLSPAWDAGRAPEGRRALTISTHTELDGWWDLFEHDRPAYEVRKQIFVERVLDAAERVLPNLREAADLILPGTPVTFQRFTRRAWGWVGGFPQTNLFRAWGPRLAPGLWMVGDSIFPGQSVPAVALGGMRVASAVVAEAEQ